MIDDSPSPDQIQSGKLLLRTAGACDINPRHLLEVFGRQRQRFVAVLQGFGPDDWAAPTRCADWCAHDVVRHLCDGNGIGIAVGSDDRTLDLTAGFDPRITPRRWLNASASESPDATLARFVATSDKLLTRAGHRLAHNRRFDVRMPYGPMDWTVLMLHGFWDSWLHERDVLLARGADHPTDDAATAYAAAYGVFIAAAVASIFGDPVSDRLRLGGDGGGVFDLDTREAVTLTVTTVTTSGPPVAQVTDALAGRPQTAAVLGELPTRSRADLAHLADFFNTPVDQGTA